MNRSQWDVIFAQLEKAVQNKEHKKASKIRENIDILLEKENECYYESYDCL